MVRLRKHRHGNKQQPRNTQHRFHTILSARRFPISEQRAIDKRAHLLHQLLIQRHSFDMREDSLVGFQPKVRERFPGDAGDERRSDVQQHVHRRLIYFPDLNNRRLKNVQHTGRGIGSAYDKTDIAGKDVHAYRLLQWPQAEAAQTGIGP